MSLKSMLLRQLIRRATMRKPTHNRIGVAPVHDDARVRGHLERYSKAETVLEARRWSAP
jgi:hypothetical protein